MMYQAQPKYTGNNHWEISGYKYTTRGNDNYASGTVRISEDLEVQIQAYNSRDMFKLKLINILNMILV